MDDTEERLSNEPDITINDKTLSVGEAMTFRVALENFAMYLHEGELNDDEHGKAMTVAYLARIDDIRKKIFVK